MKKLEATFIRAIINDSLRDCTDGQRLIFKKMYSPDDWDLPMAEVIDNMPKKRLVLAMQQVENTLEKVQKV